MARAWQAQITWAAGSSSDNGRRVLGRFIRNISTSRVYIFRGQKRGSMPQLSGPRQAKFTNERTMLSHLALGAEMERLLVGAVTDIQVRAVLPATIFFF
jgi:hypothetical protein